MSFLASEQNVVHSLSHNIGHIAIPDIKTAVLGVQVNALDAEYLLNLYIYIYITTQSHNPQILFWAMNSFKLQHGYEQTEFISLKK